MPRPHSLAPRPVVCVASIGLGDARRCGGRVEIFKAVGVRFWQPKNREEVESSTTTWVAKIDIATQTNQSPITVSCHTLANSSSSVRTGEKFTDTIHEKRTQRGCPECKIDSNREAENNKDQSGCWACLIKSLTIWRWRVTETGCDHLEVSCNYCAESPFETSNDGNITFIRF